MKLSSFLRLSSKTTNPQANPSIVYNLYSLPSFDDGRKCEVVHGSEIQSNKFIVPDKCILFNKLNVRFKRIWRIDNTEPNKIASTEFLPLVVDESIVDFHYCYYLLRSDRITDYLTGQNTNTSGSHKRIDPDNFFDIEVSLPPLEDQKRIGEVLSNLDMKIDINTSLNHYLEAMAKQLYDYWFVQFDFPDENGKPYKSSGGKMVWNDKLKREIPKGWYGDNICRVAEILSGGTPSKAINSYWEDGLIPFFGPTDCDGNLFQLKTSDHITYDGLNHCASSLFTEGTIILTARGSIGKYVIVGTPMAMNQSCYALHSIKEEHEYLYFLTGQLISHLKMKGSGSVFKSIIASDIEHSYLSIGDEKVISTFCKVVKPLFEEIKLKSCEMNNLQEQRDNLLPLLMNGQVSIKQLNNDLSSTFIIIRKTSQI